jgi:glycosyltransferase involved in cell wall biosynthesis
VRVSVVIPVYQRQQEAEAALRSVLAQEGVRLEAILVDDGSPEPFRLPSQLRGRSDIRLIRLEGNAGAAAARNRGVSEAVGDVIAFLDSDDVWRKDKLFRQLRHMQDAGKDAVDRFAFVTGFRQIDLGTRAIRNRIPIASDRPDDFVAGCWFAPGSTAVMARDLFHRIGGFDETLTRLEDLDFFIRLGLAGGGVMVLPELLADIHVGERPSRKRLEAAVERMRAKWLRGDRDGLLSARQKRRLEAYLMLERAANRRAHSDRSGFLMAMARSLALSPRRQAPLKRWWR